MHATIEDQQPSWSRRRVLFTCVVGVALMLAVVGVGVQGSAISNQLQLFRVNTASHLRAAANSATSTTIHAADVSAAGSIGSDVVSSSSAQSGEQSGSLLQHHIQSGHGSDQDQHDSSSSSKRDESSSNPATTSSSYEETQQPSSSGASAASSLHGNESRSESQEDTPSASATHDDHEDAQSVPVFSDSNEDKTSMPTLPTTGTSENAMLKAEIRPPSVPLLVPGFETPTRDPALPPAVHALWIGDINRVASGLDRYRAAGFELTIHNDVDSILDGFAPHVKLAYSLAIPRVVGFDFLKFLMLYKYGGLVVDADTYPNVSPSEVQYSSDCHVLFGKETHLDPWQFAGPTYRRIGGNTYGLSRPYQLLNWAMLAREPRNPHVAALIDGAMQHFFGLRDVEESFVQDIAGSGLMSDYVGLLYAENGRDYVAAFNAPTPPMSLQAVDGLCMLENELRGGWIHHEFMNTWRQE